MNALLKKIIALALAMVMVMGLVAGCGSAPAETEPKVQETKAAASDAEGEAEDPAIDLSEHVTLKMYLLGDRTPDFDKVYDKINEILEEKLNCSIEVEFLSWGEHNTKYSLLFSSGTDFDLIFTASGWGHYQQTVALNGFYEMTEEFIQTYAPGIWEVVPSVAWDQARIGGKVYMVPNYQNEIGLSVLAVRGDLMEKYGYEDLGTWEELAAFYMDVAQNEDSIYGCGSGAWNTYFQCQGLEVFKGGPETLTMYNMQDPEDLNIYYMADWEGFADFCKQAKEMADAGVWSKDVLNTTEESQTGLMTGRTATMTWNLESCAKYAAQANSEHPDWNVTIVDPSSKLAKKVNAYTNNGVAININSKYPERAMMVLNEFYTNPEIYDLAMLGIEGVHWEAVGDDQYKVIDESGYGVNSNCNWGWSNENLTRTEYIENPTELDEVCRTMKEKWVGNIKAPHPYDGFTFDTTNVSTQMAAVQAVISTYYDPLQVGLVDDVDATIEQMKTALEAAGMNDIIEELERQLADYVAAQG